MQRKTSCCIMFGQKMEVENEEDTPSLVCDREVLVSANTQYANANPKRLKEDTSKLMEITSDDENETLAVESSKTVVEGDAVQPSGGNTHMAVSEKDASVPCGCGV